MRVELTSGSAKGGTERGRGHGGNRLALVATSRQNSKEILTNRLVWVSKAAFFLTGRVKFAGGGGVLHFSAEARLVISTP